MKNRIFTGSGVAIVTPMIGENAEKVDYDMLGKLIDFQIENKTDAIVICGTTGEASSMPDDEHLAVIEYAVKKVGGFIQREAQQLTKEINETKLAKFMDEKIVPFAQKHKKATTITKAVAPFAVMAGSLATQIGLADSLSEDIKEKATLNFIKGKKIQAQAREHFDSIDAQEV